LPRRKPAAEAQNPPEPPELNPELALELDRLLQDKAYGDYFRRRIAEEFAPVVTAFLESAKTGSAVHMRMIVAMLEEITPTEAAEGQDPARQLLEEIEELHRRGALQNL
jgi:hypothetical protein